MLMLKKVASVFIACAQVESLLSACFTLATGHAISFACLISLVFKTLQCNLKHCTGENVFRINRLCFLFIPL